MGGDAILKDVGFRERGSPDKRYDALSRTDDFVDKYSDHLKEERVQYEASYIPGSALRLYEKPEGLVEVLDAVRQDEYVDFLYSLEGGLNTDLINRVIVYMQSKGTNIVAYNKPESAAKEAEEQLGLQYRNSLEEIGQCTCWYSYRLDESGVKDIVFVNLAKINTINPVEILVGLSHEWGHREEIRGNTAMLKYKKSGGVEGSTEVVSSLYGIHAANVADKLGGANNFVQKGLVDNLMILDVVFEESLQ